MDRTYHDRHRRRAAQKAALIAANIPKHKTLLDIGCNRGAISRDLLRISSPSHITGIDLDRSTLLPDVETQPNFFFIEGNIIDTLIPGRFDVTLYLAVHHHIVANYGLLTALETARKVAKGTTGYLFFESGKILEGNYWKWQPSLKNYFSYDEEHYHCLIEALEDLITGWNIIGFNRIHGIRREIFCFKLKDQHNEELETNSMDNEMQPSFSISNATQSPNQSKQLRSSPVSRVTISTSTSGSKFILKEHVARPLANRREHMLSNALSESWAVKGRLGNPHGDFLIFPFIQKAIPLVDLNIVKLLHLDARITPTIHDIRSALKHATVTYPRALYPGEERTSSLYDICDINPSNILIKLDSENSLNLFLIDFAYQSPSYAWKNDINFSKSIGLLHGKSAFTLGLAISGYLKGIVQLAHMQFRSRYVRIEHRFPSFISLLLTWVMNGLGRTFKSARPN